MKIFEYRTEYETEVVSLMAQLQEHECSLSADRAAGQNVAEDQLKFVLELCEQNDGKIYLSSTAGDISGFVSVCRECAEDGEVILLPEYRCYGLITDLIVDRRYRGLGIARELVTQAESHCKSLGLSQILVSALHTNTIALKFYEKNAYQAYEVTFAKNI